MIVFILLLFGRIDLWQKDRADKLTRDRPGVLGVFSLVNLLEVHPSFTIASKSFLMSPPLCNRWLKHSLLSSGSNNGTTHLAKLRICTVASPRRVLDAKLSEL